MQRQLIVLSGPDSGRTFRLDDGQTLTIGRGQASNTQINDPRMSRVHCRVAVDGGKTILTDAGSTGGTHVGQTQITEHELRSGEVFRLGETEIRFVIDGIQDEATIAGDQAFGRPKPQPKSKRLQDLVGESFADYRLDSIITMGNSGMVFKGTDTKRERPVAVKVLAPDFANSEEQKERFVRAMKTMLPIKHPNIVRLYNAGKKGPFCWAAMEYVDGESMLHVIDRIGIEGMLDWRAVWRVAVHIARALNEAHENHIVHRNVTPANILQRSSDKVCLLGDLVLAKAMEGTMAKQVTQPGQLIGDVPYMSPERTRDSASADHRSDLYGLGATLYALLTGRPPFEGESLPVLIQQVRDKEPRPPKEFQLSIEDRFQDIVMQLLTKRPDDRYQTPRELLKDLDRVGMFNALHAD
ncbi:FHA domain-containing serine/threonine-protein kinase [Stieleria varia]|uniref:Serine/threonine-protein kinase PknB n=1 Tax=Stieleria varia TaxID=2528005 RepID=A0A5C6B5W0_9BACT|nr:FHA domain-containing serine/threonine-protein kinase [Stieleria varia]TWU07493.1 Serine/threonine-protein kinase PknB [Stieleria varia]